MARARFLFAAALCGFALTAASAPAADLSVSLRAGKTSFTTSEDVNVRFTIANAGTRGQRVYVWQTPLRGVEHDLFEVLRDGEPVAYLGIEAKRPAPSDTDFVWVGAGRSRSVDVELTTLYDMSQPGAYSVRYRAGESTLLRRSGLSGEVASEALTVELSGPARRSPLAAAPGGGEESFGAFSYTKCSATQQTQVVAAMNQAVSYSGNALSYLSGTVSTRFTTWFGPATSSAVNNIKGHFTAINDRLANKAMGFNCGCKKPYYAYVYPSDAKHTVYLCKYFWLAPNAGTDSRAGTLVHETSHFNDVASTDDNAYGQTACKSLALSSPSQAQDNADSHEYFAENTPALN